MVTRRKTGPDDREWQQSWTSHRADMDVDSQEVVLDDDQIGIGTSRLVSAPARYPSANCMAILSTDCRLTDCGDSCEDRGDSPGSYRQISSTDCEERTEASTVLSPPSELTGHKCPICFEDILRRDGRAKSECGACGNLFHTACFQPVLLGDSGNCGYEGVPCPVCRQDIDRKDLSDDYSRVSRLSRMIAQLPHQEQALLMQQMEEQLATDGHLALGYVLELAVTPQFRSVPSLQSAQAAGLFSRVVQFGPMPLGPMPLGPFSHSRSELTHMQQRSLTSPIPASGLAGMASSTQQQALTVVNPMQQRPTSLWNPQMQPARRFAELQRDPTSQSVLTSSFGVGRRAPPGSM